MALDEKVGEKLVSIFFFLNVNNVQACRGKRRIKPGINPFTSGKQLGTKKRKFGYLKVFLKYGFYFLLEFS